VTARSLLTKLTETYSASADRGNAAPMRAYMRDQFAFLGIPKKPRDELDRGVLTELPKPTEDDLATIARACWKKPEREYQYFAMKLLRKHAKQLTNIGLLEALITHKSWWDTVDELAQNVVSVMVARDPKLLKVMDAWSRSDDLWLARTAILHQNKFKERTDEKRLFKYCRARAGDQDFFMRKAIGWALRNYAATNANAVARFVHDNEERLSALSKREAMRGVERSLR